MFGEWIPGQGTCGVEVVPPKYLPNQWAPVSIVSLHFLDEKLQKGLLRKHRSTGLALQRSGCQLLRAQPRVLVAIMPE